MKFKKGHVPSNKGIKGWKNSGSFVKGHSQSNTGKTHFKKLHEVIISEIQKQKISQSRLERKKKLGYLNSQETREKIKKGNTGKCGKMASHWKGGITPLNMQIRGCFKMRQWRSDIFTRDNFTCQECAIKGGYLEAHHKKHFSDIILENNIKTLEAAIICEELWDINNGKTLCDKCHDKTKNGRNKSD